MMIKETKDYNEMSQYAAAQLLQCLKGKPDALFCIATGSSPTEAYRLFVQNVQEEHIDTSNMRIISLDEWCGLQPDHPATCESYIRKHILEPLNISDEHFISFDSSQDNETYECNRLTNLLMANGGIDCCVLGLGKNGHLGLNEPNLALNPFVHKAVLDEKTKTHSMLTANRQTVTTGYTLGIKNLLDAKKILLLVTGAGKQQAYQNLLKKTISSYYPANYLWLHNNATCITDTRILST